jgi:hypothetical protein
MPPKQIFVARQGSMGEHVEWAVNKTGICKVSMWPPTEPGRVQATVRVKKPEDDPAVAVRAKLVQLGWGPLLEPAAATPEASSETGNADAEVAATAPEGEEDQLAEAVDREVTIVVLLLTFKLSHTLIASPPSNFIGACFKALPQVSSKVGPFPTLAGVGEGPGGREAWQHSRRELPAVAAEAAWGSKDHRRATTAAINDSIRGEEGVRCT